MAKSVELSIDVTAVGLGVDAQQAVTVYLPDGPLADPPVVCFAFPGGGYGRRYYSFDMPGAAGGGQAGFHTSRGWIFVACDHLGFGDSTIPDREVLNYDRVALGNKIVVETVMSRLADGSLAEGCTPLRNPTKIGIGQSMGGCFTIVLQGQHHTFDGIAPLGFSGIHTVVPTRPGDPPAVWPWLPRNTDPANPTIMNAAAVAMAAGAQLRNADDEGDAAAATGEHPFAWSFHYDDVPRDVVARDMHATAHPDMEDLPSWRSPAPPPACALQMVSPGTVALEAACVTVPVLCAMGERDVVPDPALEPRAYKSSADVTVYVCPRMGHMHNFASTRMEFWQRIHSWGRGVAEMRKQQNQQTTPR